MKVKMQARVGFDRVKMAIACLLLVVYGLGLDLFISAVPGFEVIVPKYIWVGFFIVTFPILLLSSKIKEKIQSPLLVWLAAYNLISLIGLTYSIDDESAYIAFINICATNLILLPAWLAADCANRLPYWLCCIVFTISTASVVSDFFFPFQTFGINTQGIVDRAAGLYLNSNQAGIAICFLELLLILRSPPRLILPVILIGLVATVLTFSRGAFLLQAVMLLGLLWVGVLPKEVRFSAILSLLAVPSIGVVSGILVNYLDLSDTNVLNRLAFITGQDDVGAVASDDRYYIFITAIQSYLEHPFFGGGLGYHLYWDEIGAGLGSTHNMTLRYMLDFGFIGLFIWAAFCLVIFLESRRSGSLKLALVLAILALLTSLFSHNLAEQGFFMIPIYLAAAAGFRSNLLGFWK